MSIDEIIQRIEGLLDRVESKLDEVRNRINSLLSKVPGFLHWAVGRIQDAWNKLCDKLAEFWDWFTDKLAYAGDPLLLEQTGKDWNTLLGEPTHHDAAKVETGRLLVDDTWTGDGADAYKADIGGQKSALEAVGQTYASAVSGALNGLKTGLIEFWTGVIVGLIALVTGIIAGAAATGTIIGIPAGVASIIFAVIGFLTAAGAGGLALKLSADDTASSLQTLIGYAEPWPSFGA